MSAMDGAGRFSEMDGASVTSAKDGAGGTSAIDGAGGTSAVGSADVSSDIISELCWDAASDANLSVCEYVVHNFFGAKSCKQDQIKWKSLK